MGIYERQKVKHDERIRRVLSERLRPGEAVVVQLGASSRMSVLKLFIALFPGAFLLEYTGRGAYSSWMTGLAVGIWFVFVIRQYMLVLTDQRFLAIRLRRLSTKKVDEVTGCEKNDLKRIDFEMGILNGKLIVACGDSEEKYGVALIYKERAEQLAIVAGATKPGT